MALVGIELETLVSESDTLTTRPPQWSKHIQHLSSQLACYSGILYLNLIPFEQLK